jgi:hypothetical protein
LALLGFYFFDHPDAVKCAFCKIVIREFQEGDEALQEHRKHSPNCPLLLRRSTNNIPISEALLNETLPHVAYDECGSENLSNHSDEIKYPEYSLLQERLKSFNTWPVGIKQKPNELAEAGFFYSGQSDMTLCFSCGVCIGQWEPNDNVWVEHELHSKAECNFLKLNHETVKINQQEYDEFMKLQKEIAGNELTNEQGKTDNEERNPIQYESLCKICLEKRSNVIFLPCRHVAVCGQCVFGIGNLCPICRTQIKEKINLFYS